ncbi:hypothetical protein SteCoe_3026 [Stentor coeruleus]|uniref:Uncharacterized protein n=1 Tax=Stentor coeruleus TaxID=5963 RepID=A0A1R2CYA9_9CILI|nr:hypothetical protein SteCoe_3026 [Stentor coeruleus]
MSKKETGCLSFLLTACSKQKPSKKHKAILESITTRTLNTATQTSSEASIIRNSTPANLYPSFHKPTIAIKSKLGFQLQNSNTRNSIKNDYNKENASAQISFPDSLECIKESTRFEPLLSNNTINVFFNNCSPRNSLKSKPDPFLCRAHSDRPKLMAITPDQFYKRKHLPALRPCKAFEKIFPDNEEF